MSIILYTRTANSIHDEEISTENVWDWERFKKFKESRLKRTPAAQLWSMSYDLWAFAVTNNGIDSF